MYFHILSSDSTLPNNSYLVTDLKTSKFKCRFKRYNKNNLLVRESSFEEYETEIQSQKESQKPIGFIYKSSFTVGNTVPCCLLDHF